MRRICVELDANACFTLAFALLIIPFQWILFAACAALVHEIGHIAVILLTGGRILRMRIGAAGAVIEMEPMGRVQEFLCTLAGPAASFGLLLLRKTFPGVAACALLQGIFNMLPIYPLDGGRMMRCAFGRRRSAIIELMALTLLLVGTGILSVSKRIGFFQMILAVTIILRAILRKFPCKADQIGVQ